MKVSIALVHHANQYLITDGYDNREGLSAVVGAREDKCGLACVLEMHRQLRIPLNLHISGTLLEAIAWHAPGFLNQVRAMIDDGLIEVIGSSYGQNIMRFFGDDYNRKQLNEELHLYREHLKIDPHSVKTFWPPERVWETKRMAHVLRDAALLNTGYRNVILDDRLLLKTDDENLPREDYDDQHPWTADLFRMYEIEGGLGLLAFPIATRLRHSIPPKKDEDWQQVRRELEGLLVHASNEQGDLLAIYADDMEKVSGIGEWGSEGPEYYEAFLKWLNDSSSWVVPVRLTDWADRNEVAGRRPIETGTFEELARQFDAGEGYERWFLAADWAPYRGYFNWAEKKVQTAQARGADPALLELAEKQLLVGNWETAWHTPRSGPHGDPNENGHASPWAKALTSHCRHAGVIAAAACWMRDKDGLAHAFKQDFDNDGEDDVLIKNNNLFVLISARWGGRIVAMFSVSGERGAMVVGNPCDDWNWMEELNRYMEVPRNHPGAFADVGFENDRYDVTIDSDTDVVRVTLTNAEPGSAARGLRKVFSLKASDRGLKVEYHLPKGLSSLSTECGLSPDYLELLRKGSRALQSYESRHKRGCVAGDVRVWVRPGTGVNWETPYQERFGHGCAFRVGSSRPEFSVEIGVTRLPLEATPEPAAVEEEVVR